MRVCCVCGEGNEIPLFVLHRCHDYSIGDIRGFPTDLMLDWRVLFVSGELWDGSAVSDERQTSERATSIPSFVVPCAVRYRHLRQRAGALPTVILYVFCSCLFHKIMLMSADVVIQYTVH